MRIQTGSKASGKQEHIHNIPGSAFFFYYGLRFFFVSSSLFFLYSAPCTIVSVGRKTDSRVDVSVGVLTPPKGVAKYSRPGPYLACFFVGAGYLLGCPYSYPGAQASSVLLPLRVSLSFSLSLYRAEPAPLTRNTTPSSSSPTPPPFPFFRFPGGVLSLRQGVLDQDHVAPDGRGEGPQAELRVRQLLEEGGRRQRQAGHDGHRLRRCAYTTAVVVCRCWCHMCWRAMMDMGLRGCTSI